MARGLELHTTLAVNPDGVALGVLRAAFDAPAPPNPEAEGEPPPKPREERKSFRWIEGLRDCAQAAEQLSQTRVVCVMDREADFLDLFVEHRAAAPQIDLLIRAKADRVLGREKTPDGQTVSRRLFDTVRNAPARGAAKVEVQRLSARVKASKQARKDRREARVADVTLRYQQVPLRPGTSRSHCGSLREEQPPPAAEPLEWFLLTTLRVSSADDATRILQWYVRRWRIEDRVGCPSRRPSGSNAPWPSRHRVAHPANSASARPAERCCSPSRARHLRPLTQAGAPRDAVASGAGGWLGRQRDLMNGYTQLAPCLRL